MTSRADLLLEVDATLDGSGAYTSVWIDSAEVLAVRVIWDPTPGNVGYIVQSTDQTNTFPAVTFTYNSEIDIAARYFRFSVGGGVANTPFKASIRATKVT